VLILRQVGTSRPTYARAMVAAVGKEAARRVFLASGRRPDRDDGTPPEIVASWERSSAHYVDPDRLTAHFVGLRGNADPLASVAEDVFAEFFARNGEAACSLVLIDPCGVVLARRDGDPPLGRLLDELVLVPGASYAERDVGTTAAGVALHEGSDTAVSGPEHYNGQLACLNEAAALVADPQDGRIAGAVVVLCHCSDDTSLLLPMARLLAEQLTDRMAGDAPRRALLDAFRGADRDGAWVLASDGDCVVSNATVRRLGAQDVGVLSDLVLASTLLGDLSGKHLDLPSGVCAEVAVTAVHVAGEAVGRVLTGGPAGASRPEDVAEAVRRQGSHVAPTVRRDYAADLRRTDHAREHAEARIRANRELLSPFLRAQESVAASVTQGRNHLLIGEPGVGKRTLLMNRFRQAHPHRRVVTIDCASFAGQHDEAGRNPAGHLLDGHGERPHLLVLHALNAIGPVGARRLDETLRPLVALPSPPLLVGCVDTSAVDASRPYGLLLRHFHEMIRVPALRYRADEIGEIALSILRRLAGGRSLRLSPQVIRVLEGYAWPGNISELEDVLRFVVARKPLGEIQPPDLPALCFQGRARRMSMLEAAQCDATIQALYESRGNRYKAAAMLGIARSSLYRKIDAFGISYIA
jgi:transcriptional regulator of acetoin/glycerol metabolism